MTKSELIEVIFQNNLKNNRNLTKKNIETIINSVFSSIKDSLKKGEKVEIRGFGSFKVRNKQAKTGRNPKTGKIVDIPAKRVPHFKPGKEIKELLIKSK